MDAIDIPELCMRNIAVLLPQDQLGVALLHFVEGCGYLIVTRQGVLHMIRRIDSGRRRLVESADDDFGLQECIAGISLEVQRSLDYYESHYDCRPISEIVLAPGAGLDPLPVALNEHLGLSITPLRLDELFSLEDDLTLEQQGSCVLAIGAALRSNLPEQLAVAS